MSKRLAPPQNPKRDGFVVEEDTRLASLTWPVIACGAGMPDFCSCHGTQTETGNHGRMGRSPKHTRLVYRLQLGKRVREQSIYFPARGVQNQMGLFFHDSLRFMDLIFKL